MSRVFNGCLLALLMFAIVSTTAQNYDYCNVLHDSLLFYEAQRSGRLPSTQRVTWRGNAALGDCTTTCTHDANGDGDLAGGYHDAGDHVKFGFPMAFSVTTLSWGLIEFESAISACGELQYYLDTIKWATDYFIKAHTGPNEFWGQVGNGGTDHSYWGPPELMTMERPAYKIDAAHPGTDLAMETAAALAAASIVFKDRDSSYSSLLLQHARQLWTFGDTYRGFYHDSITDAANYYRSYSYNDEIVWATAWLYRATGESSFLTRAQSDYTSFNVGNNAPGQSFDWDNKNGGCVVLMARITGQEPYKSDATRFLNSWLPGGGVTYTPGGLAWHSQWGPNRYAAGPAFLALVIGSDSGNNFAKSQVNYFLGSNPQGQSFVIGHGTKSPVNPHHRASHHSLTNDINTPVMNTYLLKGALVGGPDAADLYVDDRHDYVKNEVSCDYNAAFTCALAGLAKLMGQTGSGSSSGSVVEPAPPSQPSSSSSTSADAATSTSTTGTPAVGTTSGTTTGDTPSGGITIVINSGSSQWWVSVSVHNGAQETSKVELKDSGIVTAFTQMESTNYGAFVYSPSGALVAPISLRLTSQQGTVITIDNVITSITAGTVIPTSAQYGSSSGTASSPSVPTPAPSVPSSTSSSSSTTGAAPSSTIKLELNGGSNDWWIAVTPKDGLSETTGIELKDSDKVSSWTAMTLTNYGPYEFHANGNPLKAPLSFRLTSKTGQQVIATNIVASIVGGTVDTKVQYT